MLYNKYIVYLLCLINFGSCLSQETEIQNIERNKMNDQKEVQISSEWLNFINDRIKAQKGSYLVKDQVGKDLVIEWEKINPSSEDLNGIIKDVSSLLVKNYTEMELGFAKKHPERVSQEMFLKPLESIFKNGIDNVNWGEAKEILRKNLQKFFLNTDFAKFSNPNEIQLFVTAKDPKDGNKLGVIQFLISQQLEYGTVKIAFFAVDSSQENWDIEKLLISCAFRLIPDVKRLFLHTRITNEKAIKSYQNLGFTKFFGALVFWTDLEYLADKSNILQEFLKV